MSSKSKPNVDTLFDSHSWATKRQISFDCPLIYTRKHRCQPMKKIYYCEVRKVFSLEPCKRISRILSRWLFTLGGEWLTHCKTSWRVKLNRFFRVTENFSTYVMENISGIKVHKTENCFVSNFEFCTISLLVLLKYEDRAIIGGDKIVPLSLRLRGIEFSLVWD